MTALKRIDVEPTRDDYNRVIDAINHLDEGDLDRRGAWQPLADLSSRTAFEAIDADPASVNFDGQQFEAVASIYVTLIYGPSNDEESMSDEYVATVRGTVTPDEVEVEEVAVDTSSFYEE